MKILYRYIGLRLAFGWLLVFMILSILFSSLELVGQLDDIGQGNYHLIDAFRYIAYTFPGRVMNLAAVSSLLGSIVALGTLASGDELLAMRACGFSVFRIARVVLSAGIVIMLGTLLLAQYIVPPLEQRAKIDRELALSDIGTFLPSGGFWTRDHGRYINVRSSSYNGELADVSIYEFDSKGKPSGYVSADKAEINDEGYWIGQGARKVTFEDLNVSDIKVSSLALDVFLSAKQVDVLSITPAMLSINDLYRYIKILRQRGQNTDPYVLALWQKTTLPLKIGAMIFFSLSFVFGQAREANPGRRVTLGSIVGISYYYFDQALGYMGLLLGLHPAFSTLLPLAIITLMATWLLLRVP